MYRVDVFRSSDLVSSALRFSDPSNPPKAIKVLVTGKIHDVGLNLLRNPPANLVPPLPLEIVVRPDCSRAELMKEVADTHVLLTRSETDVDKEVLAAGKVLSVVARAAVGYGNIDLTTATEMGILVVNTPGKNTNSAAELTWALLLGLVRKVTPAHESTSRGGWNRHHFSGTELQGKRIGIVGLGNVGHRVAQFAHGFDMEVFAYDPYLSDEVFRRHRANRCRTLQEMLPNIDVLTVHTPLNKETTGMIGSKELALLPLGSTVLNAARGGIIDEPALLKALNDGKVLNAGIDTWVGEPKPLPELVSHKQVLSTPHIGASTEEAQHRIGEAVAYQILKALRSEIVDYPVNLPHLNEIGSSQSRQWAVLAEKVGVTAAQIFSFNPQKLRMLISPEIPPEDHGVLKISALKGFLKCIRDEFVSYVNAEKVLDRTGIQMSVELVSLPYGVRGGIQLDVLGSTNSEIVQVGAVLYSNELPRLCFINGFLFEIEPQGQLVVLQNHDRPGVIGDVGCYLASQGVNISQFELARNAQGGQALSILKVDGGLTTAQSEGLRQLRNVISVRTVEGL